MIAAQECMDYTREDLTQCHLNLGIDDTTQRYPGGDDLCADYFKRESVGILDKATPIGSIGRCIAKEIRTWLLESGYSYVYCNCDWPSCTHGSGPWGTVYNTFCIRQEFERGRGWFKPSETQWINDEGYAFDPYRTETAWIDSTDAKARELEIAESMTREVLESVQVMVITIGVNEIWFNRDDGAVFFQYPKGNYDRDRHGFRCATVEENVENLEVCLSLLRGYNPECKIVLSVSPVPLTWTFRKDCDVVQATAESKATLLLAAKKFAAEHPSDVFYFPSYEIVTMASRGHGFKRDNRHVNPMTVDAIMDVFEHNFCR